MKLVIYTILITASLLFTGCVSDPSLKFRDDLDLLKKKVWLLEKGATEDRFGLAQRQNELRLISEKVEKLEKELEDLRREVDNRPAAE